MSRKSFCIRPKLWYREPYMWAIELRKPQGVRDICSGKNKKHQVEFPGKSQRGFKIHQIMGPTVIDLKMEDVKIS